MHHRVGPRRGHRRLDVLRIAQIADDELRARVDGLAVPQFETVEDHDLVARVQQVLRGDAADVAGAAGDEYFHECESFSSSASFAFKAATSF